MAIKFSAVTSYSLRNFAGLGVLCDINYDLLRDGRCLKRKLENREEKRDERRKSGVKVLRIIVK